MAEKIALLIGNQEYDDLSSFPSLQKTAADVKGLSKVLKDPRIGSFDKVIPIFNETKAVVESWIEDLFLRRKSDDLLLLFFAGHGTKTDDGALYFACKNTRLDKLLSTGISSKFILDAMDQSASKRQVLILDCCYSGAFSKHTRAGVIGTKIDTDELFRGNGLGKVVLTATNSIQRAYEGHEIIGESENSIFTHYLIQGLQSGAADLDHDGIITIDELHTFVYDRVIGESTKQTPQKFSFDYQGVLYLARNPVYSRGKTKQPRAGITISGEIKRTILTVQEKVCPILRDLGQNATAQGLDQKAIELGNLSATRENTPVMLLGLTGAGKTSLMNAMLGKILGRAGGGEAQSAAVLVVSHQPNRYNSETSYISLDELLTMINKVHFDNPKGKDLSKRPDQQQLPKQIKIFLDAALRDANVIYKRQVTLEDLDESIANLLVSKKQEKNFHESEYDDLVQFVADHTNSRGKYWAITKEMKISGPFPGLRPQVTIMDLPGLGDLNQMRVEKTREALRESDQIMIVVGERGFTEDIRGMLNENQIISYMLTNPRIAQTTIVGTKLDDTHINDDDHIELGLGDDPDLDEIVQAKFRSWTELVSRQWKEMLSAWAKNTNVTSNEDYELTVEKIIENTDFIPCSPNGYLCSTGLVKDRKNYREIFPQKDGTDTGIPAVRQSIFRLADEQRKLRKIKIERSYQAFKQYLQSVLSSLNAISQDMKYSKNIETKYLEISRQFSRIMEQNGEYRLDSSLNAAKRKIQKTESIAQKGWKGLDQKTIEKFLNEILGELHFQTFLATLRKGGIHTSKVSKKEVHIPSNMSTYVAEPIVRFVNEVVFPEFLATGKLTIVQGTKDLHLSINEIIEDVFSDQPLDTVALFKEEVHAFLSQHSADINDLSEQLFSKVDQININALEIAYQSVGSGFQSVMSDSLNKEAQGRGARQRVIDELTKQVNQKKPEIIRACSIAFNDRIMNILQHKNQELENDLLKRKRLILNNIMEYGTVLFGKNKIKDRKNKVKALTEILKEL